LEAAEMQDTSSIIGSISTFAAMMAGISIAVERVVEMIKGAIPPLASAWPKHDEIRGGILQFIAAAAGTIIASLMPDQIRNSLPASLGVGLHWAQYVVIGLMASGGSGAWNHALDILGALKSKQETAATANAAALAQAKAAAKAAGA
jgi:hypothetical protein